MGSTRYISSMGELTRKDNSLCFRKDGKNVYIPIENTKEIILYNQNGYYAWVLELLAKLVQMGFNDTSIFSHIKVFNEQSDVLRYLKEKIKKEG